MKAIVSAQTHAAPFSVNCRQWPAEDFDEIGSGKEIGAFCVPIEND